MPNKPKTPMLSVRCDRELRDAAREKANGEGADLTKVIVAFLRRYVAGEEAARRPKRGVYSGSASAVTVPPPAELPSVVVLRLGHAYEPGPNARCGAKDCGRKKVDH